MGAFGPLVFVFEELFGADRVLRAQAHQVREAATGLAGGLGDLPPEAQSMIAGLATLSRRLDLAADDLAAAATVFGATGAEASRVDGLHWMDIAKAVIAVGAAEASGALLRRAGTGRIDDLRRQLRTSARELRTLEQRRRAALTAGDPAAVRRIDRQIDQRVAGHRAVADRLREAKTDLAALRESGQLKSLDARTLQVLKELSGALGLNTATALLTVHEWREAMRGRRGPLDVLRGRAESLRDRRHVPEPAKRLAGGSALRHGMKALPVLGVAADGADLVNKVRKAWNDPNAGNLAKSLAAGLHVGGNVPALGLLPDGIAYGIEGGVFITDHADAVAGAVKDVAGAAGGVVKGAFGVFK